MNTECITEAPTVEEAVDAALEELGVQQDAVEYEVLQEPGKKMFGIGGDRAAKVRVWIKPRTAGGERSRQGLSLARSSKWTSDAEEAQPAISP